MDKSETLIWLYCLVCQSYETNPNLYCQRMSNNRYPAFTDQELLTCYLFAGFFGQHSCKASYDYIASYWSDWFPDLPSYQAFNKRLNNLNAVFCALITDILAQVPSMGRLLDISLGDSMPIILAKATRSDNAKVARELADKGYCSTKNLYYHGVKLHLIAWKQHQRLPFPEWIGISEASANDLSAARNILLEVQDRNLFLDKIYHNQELKDLVEQQNNTKIYTPVKRKKGQKKLDADDSYLSGWVSKIRQPIESLFAWIEQKVQIQNASKVRSTKGLLVHVFGKIAIAMFAFLIKFNS